MLRHGTGCVILPPAGDYNAYYYEDPMRALYDAGYKNLEAPTGYSYQFGGALGSLDHGIANGPMFARARHLCRALWPLQPTVLCQPGGSIAQH